MKPALLFLAGILCASGYSVPARAAGPPDSPQTDIGGGDLAEKLNRSGGVIRPQGDIDPGIEKPAPVPEPNTTPVIPPPGAPGGAPEARPK